MATANIQVSGLAELISKYEGMPARLEAALRRAMTRAVAIVHADIATYPPSSEANSPPGAMNPRAGKPYNRWYVRGVGTAIPNRQYHNSQALGRHWTETVSVGSGHFEGKVGNSVTYAPYAQDRAQQALFHKVRGWQTVQDVAEKDKERVTDELHSGVREAISEK